MKRILAVLLAFMIPVMAIAESGNSVWLHEERARLTVGNPTPLTGRFFSGLWGGTTSDLDVQDLLHGYSLVRWDGNIARFRFDHSVVQDAVAMDDSEGNRTYLIILYDDLLYSDGTPITAYDYAFSILFQMDNAIAETNGMPADFSWILGAEEYLAGEKKELQGLRINSDQIFELTVKADALPYFYELYRLKINPYPAKIIAPGVKVIDEGNGAYLSKALEATEIRKYVINGISGYMMKPVVTSGPYTLKSFDGTTAVFEINPYYKGNEEGVKPRIGELTYTVAEHKTMISQLQSGEFDLLNKITEADSIEAGIRNEEIAAEEYSFQSYPRIGLTMIWFCESSEALQDINVRKAVAYSIDRKGFIDDYTNHYGIQVDGFFGLGQWMYQVAMGIMNYPVKEGEDTSAWEQINLDGLTRYEMDIPRAIRLLGNAEVKLSFGIPDTDEAERVVRKYFVSNLEEAGFKVTVHRLGMDNLQKAYDGRNTEYDLLFLGEDFSIAFNPDIFKPKETSTDASTDEIEDTLTEARASTYQIAREMVHSDPVDLLSFEQKWVALQESITGKLPLIPVYSNVYFDFFTRELHEYSVTEAVTWAEAIVKSYMSDMEELKEGEEEALIHGLHDMAEVYRVEK